MARDREVNDSSGMAGTQTKPRGALCSRTRIRASWYSAPNDPLMPVTGPSSSRSSTPTQTGPAAAGAGVLASSAEAPTLRTPHFMFVTSSVHLDRTSSVHIWTARPRGRVPSPSLASHGTSCRNLPCERRLQRARERYVHKADAPNWLVSFDSRCRTVYLYLCDGWRV